MPRDYEAYDVYETWTQGFFVDLAQYRYASKQWKDLCSAEEQLRVRPSPTGNAICLTVDPAAAVWIAKRLNRAASLERQLNEIVRYSSSDAPDYELIQRLRKVLSGESS